MRTLRETIIEKYTRTRDPRILQYAQAHCPEAYFALLRQFDPARCQAECTHEHWDYHAETDVFECTVCGKLETVLPVNHCTTIFMLDGFEWIDDLTEFTRRYFGKRGPHTKEGDVWIS